MKTPEEMASEYARTRWEYAARQYENWWNEQGPQETWTSFLAGYQAAQPTNIVLKSATERPPEKVLLLPDPVIPVQETDHIDLEQQMAALTAYMDECQKRILQLEDSNSSKKLDSWISVKERLPEEGQRVLLYDPLQYVCIVLAHWYSTSSLPFFDHETLDGMHITIRLYDHKHIYWMPLPEPPEKEK